jgi:hypothetical protein
MFPKTALPSPVLKTTEQSFPFLSVVATHILFSISTSFVSFYKQILLFRLFQINDLCGLYYEPHTSLIELT